MLTIASLILNVLPLTASECAVAAHARLNDRADIVDTAVAAGSFQTLVKAVQAAELVEVLKGEGPFTVFAPDDKAFARIPGVDLGALLADKKGLTKVLTYHVVPGRLMAKDVVGKKWLETVQGQSLRVQVLDGKVMIDDAEVTSTDIEASNGIIHVLNRVVTPRMDIVDTAVQAGNFQTLVAAVQAAGLVETLKSRGPFTVFAPTDAAFAALPEGMVESLLQDKTRLKAILTYHVVPGRILSTDLETTVKPVPVTTVEGSAALVLRSKDGTVHIDEAKVSTADIIVANGVIHVIDRVILPGQPSGM